MWFHSWFYSLAKAVYQNKELFPPIYQKRNPITNSNDINILATSQLLQICGTGCPVRLSVRSHNNFISLTWESFKENCEFTLGGFSRSQLLSSTSVFSIWSQNGIGSVKTRFCLLPTSCKGVLSLAASHESLHHSTGKATKTITGSLMRHVRGCCVTSQGLTVLSRTHTHQAEFPHCPSCKSVCWWELQDPRFYKK